MDGDSWTCQTVENNGEKIYYYQLIGHAFIKIVAFGIINQ